MNKKFSNLFLRDAFIVTLKNIAVQNKKVILLTNDQGAPELDDFKKKYHSNFTILEYLSKILLLYQLA